MKVKLSKDNVAILQGKICPFRNPLIFPGAIQGQIEIQGMPCTNECPHFNLNQDEQNKNLGCVVITCGSVELNFMVEIEKENTPHLNLLK